MYDPTDAIPAAGRLLRANSASAHPEKAIFDYNHAAWYVRHVLDLGRRYGGQDPRVFSPGAGGCQTGGLFPNLPPNEVTAKVVAYARAQLVKPYLWGAAGADAFDCSGLTMMAYRQAGISLSHYAADQWKNSPHVPAGQQQLGDLVFFEPKADGSGHVGLYVGGAQMIEAPNHTAPVRISSVNRPDRIGFARPSLAVSRR